MGILWVEDHAAEVQRAFVEVLMVGLVRRGRLRLRSSRRRHCRCLRRDSLVILIEDSVKEVYCPSSAEIHFSWMEAFVHRRLH